MRVGSVCREMSRVIVYRLGDDRDYRESVDSRCSEPDQVVVLQDDEQQIKKTAERSRGWQTKDAIRNSGRIRGGLFREVIFEETRLTMK